MAQLSEVRRSILTAAGYMYLASGHKGWVIPGRPESFLSEARLQDCDTDDELRALVAARAKRDSGKHRPKA